MYIMGTLTFVISSIKPPQEYYNHSQSIKINQSCNFAIDKRDVKLQICSRPRGFKSDGFVCLCTQSHSQIGEDEENQKYVENLAVPQHWLNPSRALEEAAWLRETLHKWLDDEYCPEETNAEISQVAADSYHESLLEKETDLGEILLKMATNLGRISYQESFHGAFSSANAAVNLIIQRIEHN